MNPLHPEFPDVTWKRFLLTFSIGFLVQSLLLRWAFADGTGWLLVGGSATVIAAGAWLFLGMRAKEKIDGPTTW